MLVLCLYLVHGQRLGVPFVRGIRDSLGPTLLQRRSFNLGLGSEIAGLVGSDFTGLTVNKA